MQSERGRPARSDRPDDAKAGLAEGVNWSLNSELRGGGGSPLPMAHSLSRPEAGAPPD